jgi:hypothetical protein
MARRITLVVWIVSLAPQVGCGGGADLPLVPVSGTLTFDNGPPPAIGSINFMLISGTGLGGLPDRPGSAVFDRDGTFVVSSFREGDGLLPGKYTAKIICFVGTPSEAEPASYARLDRVPPDYRPELLVEPGSGPIEVTFDVPPKRN